MTASRTGKRYPSMAIFVSLAVPLELIAGAAQPHIENEVLQPGYLRLTVAPVSGSNVSAQSISGGFNLQIEPVSVAHTVHVPATQRGISIPASICPQPRYDLTSSESAFKRTSLIRAGKLRSALRGHTIRGQC